MTLITLEVIGVAIIGFIIAAAAIVVLLYAIVLFCYYRWRTIIADHVHLEVNEAMKMEYIHSVLNTTTDSAEEAYG